MSEPAPRPREEREQALRQLVANTVAAVAPAPKYAVPDVAALGPLPNTRAAIDAHLQRLAQVSRAGDRIFSYQVCDWITPLPADTLLGRGMMGDGHIDFGPLTAAVAAADGTTLQARLDDIAATYGRHVIADRSIKMDPVVAMRG